jgi:sigma-B regulation protein RsbU (phosphoserine phosphatase)
MSVKILVVDDEPDLPLLIRQKFRRKIRSKEWDFVFAEHGLEALAKVIEDPSIDLILTDINMPGMDGLTLLNKVREVNKQIRTVVVSAYGDMDNIRTAMNRGAFDFVTKPVDFDDLEVTIRKTWETVYALKEAQTAQGKLLSIQQELDIAHTIQARFLPIIFPSDQSINLHASMTPARNVGGDFYDFFFIDDHRLGFTIGDVSGKGVSAALFMAVTRTLLKAMALQNLQPGACLQVVNRLLYPESLANMFVTVFYAVLNTQDGTLTYCNAGHNPPYKVGADQSITPLERTGGLALCLVKDFPYTDKQITLAPQDSVFVFTDGITEAMNNERNEYTEERLVALLEPLTHASPATLIDKVIQSVDTFANGAPPSDDRTMLAVQYLGPRE